MLRTSILHRAAIKWLACSCYTERTDANVVLCVRRLLSNFTWHMKIEWRWDRLSRHSNIGRPNVLLCELQMFVNCKYKIQFLENRRKNARMTRYRDWRRDQYFSALYWHTSTEKKIINIDLMEFIQKYKSKKVFPGVRSFIIYPEQKQNRPITSGQQSFLLSSNRNTQANISGS